MGINDFGSVQVSQFAVSQKISLQGLLKSCEPGRAPDPSLNGGPGC